MKRQVRSVFELYKVGAGPSSSHSIGPQRAMRIFLGRLVSPPARVRVALFGSLALTGKGHLTDRTIAGVLGAIPHEFVWDPDRANLPHPNTMTFEAFGPDGARIAEWTVRSVGGGALEDDNGPVGDTEAAAYPISSISDAIAICGKRSLAFWQFVEQHEKDLWPRLDAIWMAMRECVERGLSRGSARLPGTLGVKRRAADVHAKTPDLDGTQKGLALLSAYALAVAEENADGGTVVTAPSCGAAGVLPGILYFFETVRAVPRETILRALATAGLFGAVIRANASVSGAEVGCQGEIGSACSMAAAAAAQILGGTIGQIEYAAEIGMEHHLGLTCDPIEGYVQIPCIERNMTACLRAFECASFALLTDGTHLVSFDDAIEVMYRTGQDMQSAYRETARGGLASLWRKRMAVKGLATAELPPGGQSQCS